MADFEPPQEFDDYVVVRELGRGQMGQVYLAEDAVLARPVAIKFIAGVEPDLAARQRFLMEARTAARIHHPNVVGVYRVGEVADHPYIVSELVRGQSLADVPRPMAWTAALDIAIDLARGLAAAHRKGVVHSDLKLANAMITEEGAKLVDFGLARVVHDRDEPSAGGGLVGTPDYMAPEVWSGQAPSRRSDVYSFGALLFELIAGTTPFAAIPTGQLADTVARQPAPDLAAAARAAGQADPDARIVRLVARCLDRDPAARFASGEELREALEQLHPSRAQPISAGENPYRGLRPFESAHRGLFFGRGLEVGELVERLRTDAIAIVTGDSGVGKSSLIRAGVLPAILDGALGPGRAWKALVMVPGRRPLTALAAALGEPALAARMLADPEELPRELQRLAGAGGVVLFVDQLEELVTVGDPGEVAALEAGLARLAEGAPNVRLLATVRADFLSRIAALPRIGRELARLLYFVSPLPPERIRDVITGPATATGVTFESEAMIGTLVEATAQAGSGGLPLLSFALAELWAARDKERATISEASLAAMGGVAGALARHADATLSGMLAVERAQVRRVLLRLVTSQGTRVRRTEAELSTGASVRTALDALVAGRLLVVHDADGGATFELAHEVLVHGWGTLREWLDADAVAGARRERVGAAATAWDRAGRRGDHVWRGAQLAEASSLDAADLTALEVAFVRASQRAAVRRLWVRRGAIAGVALLLAGALLVQRLLAARRVDREIAAELDSAEGYLATARTADREFRTRADEAFRAFDRGDARAEELWQIARDARTTADAAYRSGAAHAEAALAKDPGRGDVRDEVGTVLLERALLADASHDDDRRDDLIGRLEAYDTDGSRRARWSAPGHLVIRSTAGAALALGDREIGGDELVPPGDHVLSATAPGRVAIRMPIRVERGATVELDVQLPRAGTIPPGFVYVPAGAFLFGATGDDDSRAFLSTAPLHTRSTGAFLIARTEVTVAEWFAFVADQTEADRAALVPSLPGTISGSLSYDREGDGWRLAIQPMSTKYTAGWGEPVDYTGRTTHARQDWRKFPMLGVSSSDADRYVAWLASTGRVPNARLCSELEWERAARGSDGRSFPPGDINIDVTYTRAQMGPDEVGSHPASNSPFGVADMSGNAFEWTRGEHGEDVIRGGSFFHDRKSAHLANRAVLLGRAFHDATVGLRVCASAAGIY